IKYFINNRHKKDQFQVTIQEQNIINKIKSDIRKASRNVHEKSYLSNLYYFYSRSLSQASIDKLKIEARKIENLELEIYDAKHLSQVINNFPEVRFEMCKIMDIPLEPEIQI